MAWARAGSRLLPFADAASADLPLPRLLRLSLFQFSVGMAMVMLIGTLNRVMIVELGLPAFVVSVMVALPLLFAPARALIGFRSDHHRSELGWRRVPYIWMGSLLQFGGFSIMPFALLVLAGAGQSAQAPTWVGQLGAGQLLLLPKTQSLRGWASDAGERCATTRAQICNRVRPEPECLFARA